MDEVLLAAGQEKDAAALLEFLKKDQTFGNILSVFSGGDARRRLAEKEFELVIINAPLPDEYGHELAADAAQNSCAGVLLLVKSELADSVSARVEADGVFVLAKPLNRALFFQALRLAAASRKRVYGLQKENRLLQKKIEDIRIVDRAKCVLIEQLDFTEAQAHASIEKQAMDTRRTRREIAQEIICRYTQ